MIPLRDSAPSQRFPLATYTIIAVNVVIFWHELTAPDLDQFISSYALIPANVSVSDFSQLAPFVTSQFLHGGFVHLVSNLWFLKIFGDSVEAVWGWFRFLIFYLLGGVFAGFIQFLAEPTSGIPMIGASGAVASVLGAYFVFFPRHRVETLVPVWGFWQVVTIPASVMLFYWFVTQLFSGVASLGFQGAYGGVAFFAHVGGFVFGYMVARVVPVSHRVSRGF